MSSSSSSKLLKIHARSIRLYINAGLSVPACRANRKLLDTEDRAPVTSYLRLVTCKACRRMVVERG
jgi:DNA-binding transcriptional MerR regulator